jgi:RNA polymerase sigma-70 factor (ECF subfamily)
MLLRATTSIQSSDYLPLSTQSPKGKMANQFHDDDLPIQQIRNIQAGLRTEESAEILYTRFSPVVNRYFVRKRVPLSISEDLTQETFLRLFSTLNNFDLTRKTRFINWLMEIAQHVFSNWLRSIQAMKREGVEVSLSPVSLEGEVGELPLVADVPDALSQLVQIENLEALREAIESMPEQRRRAFMLRYNFDLKYREIAVLMGVSIETVKAHLHQGKLHLEEALSNRR